MAAEIVELPVPQKLCGDCGHATMSTQGVHCLIFSEDIWDEKLAVECELFERVD